MACSPSLSISAGTVRREIAVNVIYVILGMNILIQGQFYDSDLF